MADSKVRTPKATSLLRDDHKKVKQLFASYEELENGNDAEREKLFQEIRTELSIHSRIEEEIFYPAVAMAEDKEARKLVQEALEEHKIVTTLLEEINSLRTNDDAECAGKMKALKDNVLHHAKEEEDEIFPIFEDLQKHQQTTVAEQLMARKKELEDEGIEEAGESEDLP